MSRTSIQVNVGPAYNLIVASPVFSGTDFANTLAVGTPIPANSPNLQVATIGDPGKSETNHWGWLYFDATPVAGGNTVKIQLFYQESHDQVNPNSSAGFYNPASTEANPQPSGQLPPNTWNFTFNPAPPGGTVVYSLGIAAAAAFTGNPSR
ncbi:MAG TPA: hypothetical protein VKZ53_07865 [Candidatus Angelobacter sp.]|nr:hypothetical protein [Candidatus Angelobacter sp.]